MVAARVILGTMVGALAVTAAFAMPATGTPDARHAGVRSGGLTSFFTPASADPKLAALIARSGLGTTQFRFTPADSRGIQRRPSDIALPVSAPKAVVTLRTAPTAMPVGVVPFTYDLSGSAPKPRTTINGDVKFDLATAPTTRKPMDLGTSLSGRRSTSKFSSNTAKPLDGNNRLVTDLPNSIDVGGSYSLSKRIDVTAGVRYKGQDRERLAPLPENQRDAQAVYVGTAFKF